MKKVLVLAAIVAVGLAFSPAALATGTGNSATAVTNAEIMTALTIENTDALEFGKIAPDPNGTGTGTVIVSTADARTKTGDVMLVTGTTAKAAKFTVAGDGNLAFTLNVATAESITLSDGDSNSMTVNTWTYKDDNGSFTLTSGSKSLVLSSGSNHITVGGTLNVGAAQVKGAYTNGSGISLSVVYN